MFRGGPTPLLYTDLTVKAEWPDQYNILQGPDVPYKRPKVSCDSHSITKGVSCLLWELQAPCLITSMPTEDSIFIDHWYTVMLLTRGCLLIFSRLQAGQQINHARNFHEELHQTLITQEEENGDDYSSIGKEAICWSRWANTVHSHYNGLPL